MKSNTKWILFLALVIALFFWKILFTRQFSLLVGSEAVGQAYSWYHFSAVSIQQGILPVWNPHSFSGRSFVGGMETGLFYPLKLPLYLWPLNRSGLFSPTLFHEYHVFTHFLAACFLFLLAKELGLSGFSAFVASLCFTLGGFVSKIPWPDMLDSAIWLPLILLFLIRALRAERRARGVVFACFAGLALGMAILAGRIHIVMMDVIVIVSAAAYFGAREARRGDLAGRRRHTWIWYVVIVGILITTALAFGAIQLIPSMEYGPLTMRYIGAPDPLPSTQRIPYAHLKEEFFPRSLFGFLLSYPFGGASTGGVGTFSPYFGVLPLVLTILGVWRNWSHPWVRYFSFLAVLVFFYTLGPYSLLHGLVYALVPYLWMARGAGRFIYLTHFAMALLVGFGVQTLLSKEVGAKEAVDALTGRLKWIVIFFTVALGISALSSKLVLDEWLYLSFLFIVGSYGVFLYVRHGYRSQAAAFLIVAIILCDLSGFHWLIRNKVLTQQSGTDHLEELWNCRNLANFFKKQPGLFRIHLDMDNAPNIGDLYGLYTTTGPVAATELKDYAWFRGIPKALDMLNARYIVRRAPGNESVSVYDDGLFRVYENPSSYPRAWLVHHAEVESSHEQLRKRVSQPGFNAGQTALLSEPLKETLEPNTMETGEEALFDLYQPNRLELTVRAQSRGLLILSEVFYPGWHATVNGVPVPIYKVNGLLRGIVVPRDESKVVVYYRSKAILAGSILSLCAFIGTFVFVAFTWQREKKAKEREPKDRA